MAAAKYHVVAWESACLAARLEEFGRAVFRSFDCIGRFV